MKITEKITLFLDIEVPDIVTCEQLFEMIKLKLAMYEKNKDYKEIQIL